jgi:hypothetical protein
MIRLLAAVVGVGRAESLEQDDAEVRLVVAVGVLEEQEVGAGGDDHAAGPELEAERVVDLGELDGAVGDAVPVVVGEDEQASRSSS